MLGRFVESMADAAVLASGGNFALQNYISMPCAYAILHLSQTDKFKVEFPFPMIAFNQKSKISRGILDELTSSTPAHLVTYRKKDTILENLNYTMRIIQPAIKNVCLSKRDRVVLEDTILMMIEQGLRLTNEAQGIPVGVTTFKPIFSPEFEKLFIYGVIFFIPIKK